MSTSQILETLPRQTPDERAEIQAKLAELAAEEWQDGGGELSEEDRKALEASLAAYAQAPDAGSSWEEVKARVQARLRS